MKYVLDSSVAFKVVVPEVDSDKAIRLRDEFRACIHSLHDSPQFLRVLLRDTSQLGLVSLTQGA